jgi:hypothetical protein
MMHVVHDWFRTQATTLKRLSNGVVPVTVIVDHTHRVYEVIECGYRVHNISYYFSRGLVKYRTK